MKRIKLLFFHTKRRINKKRYKEQMMQFRIKIALKLNREIFWVKIVVVCIKAKMAKNMINIVKYFILFIIFEIFISL
jgi:hypothetical protein